MMKQSRLMSFVESAINILVGFGISFGAQLVFLPMLGVSISPWQNFSFALIMTVISIARSYLLRRLFEALHIRRPLSPFMQAVIAECFRQRDVEGYDAEHDSRHSPRELAQAGAAYFLGAEKTHISGDGMPQYVSGESLWPWSDGWKPDGVRRDLVRGCALGIAGGELADSQRKIKRRSFSRPSARAPIGHHVSRELFQTRPHLAHGKSPSEQGGSSV